VDTVFAGNERGEIDMDLDLRIHVSTVCLSVSTALTLLLNYADRASNSECHCRQST